MKQVDVCLPAKQSDTQVLLSLEGDIEDARIRQNNIMLLASKYLTKAGDITLDEHVAEVFYMLICEQANALRKLSASYQAPFQTLN